MAYKLCYDLDNLKIFLTLFLVKDFWVFTGAFFQKNIMMHEEHKLLYAHMEVQELQVRMSS